MPGIIRRNILDRQMSYLIIGNGITGVTAAEVLRSADPICKLTIIAGEPFPVYYRPALKDYLAGRIVEDKLWARPATFYRQQQIRFVPGHVVGIDSVRQFVQLQDGQQKRYDKLLLANGARPGQLNCPGLQLAGVSTLRSIEDYQQLRRRLADARRIVICGSGTLALETAETLCHQGYQVTHLLRKRTLWSEVLDSTASDLVLQEERRSGVDVHLEEEITEITGKNGQVVGVNTTRGAYIPCEIVIIAIGIEPLIDFAKVSGIVCGRGIKVDAAMRTNVRNIYAAGDVVETRNNRTGSTRIIGQWYPAIHQAHQAAYSMLDQLDLQQSVSTDTFYNATFLYGLDFVSIGETTAAGQNRYQEYRAEPKPRTYRKLLLQQGVPVGALFLGKRKNALAFKRAIDHRVNLASIGNNILAEDFELDSWLDTQNVPPVNIDTGDLAAIALDKSIKNSLSIHVQTTTLAAPKQAPADAKLVPVPHPRVIVALKEEQLHLEQEEMVITIGRQKEARIHIEHASISRQHAEIICGEGQYRLRDVGSANGTFVNNVGLSPYSVHILQQNDRIRFGDVQFYFQQRGPEKKKTENPIVEGLAHRVDVRPLSEQRIRFEIDMCIGCDRCMNACPVPFSSQINIAALNAATVAPDSGNADIARFTQECILCGSCVPVCPVDNHRDLLMVALKQRQGTAWESEVDDARLLPILPAGLTLAELQQRLRMQRILSDPARVPQNYLRHLIMASQFQIIEAGKALLREGEYGRDLYMLLEGQLAVSAMDNKEQEFPIAILGPGELAGEYGMLTGQPYATTVRAKTNSLVMQVPEQVMQRLTELVPEIRNFFEQSNVDHALTSILKRMSLFQGISDEALRYLIEQTQVKSYERNTQLFTQDGEGRPDREALHILLEGFVKVARRKAEKDIEGQECIVAYRQGGDYFAGGLDVLGDSQAVSATTINRTRVAEVPDYALQALFQHYPEVKQRFKLRLQEYIASHNSAQTGPMPIVSTKKANILRQASGARRDELHSLVGNGVVEGTEVLVIDLDACIHCNECEYACERRHGHSRLNRKGIVIGNINIVTTCRQCQDPVCMLCSRAGIARLPDGEVYITESCIGCGICAERCPYHAISIVDVEDENEAQEASSWQRFNNLFQHGIVKERKRAPLPMLNASKAADKGRVAPGPLDAVQPYSGYDEMRKKLAIKCDLCAGYNDQACVQACPTGAAFRVRPTAFFGSTEKILQE